jgi:predicted enzyme related to lactoylglutathione lyase
MAQTDHDKRIDYIEFPVDDVGVAKTFYRTVFGWKFTDYGPDYASFEDGRLAGGLRGGELPTRGGALVVIYAKALEAVRDAVIIAGGKIAIETHDFPGGRRFHFTDPSGNELAVWSDI